MNVSVAMKAQLYKAFLHRSFPRKHPETRRSPIPAKSHAIVSSLTLPALQRKPTCPCGGNCPRCKAEHKLEDTFQPKLRITASNDRCEKEADRVAEEVMRTPERPLQQPLDKEDLLLLADPLFAPLVQRQAEAEEEEEEELLQPKAEAGCVPVLTPKIAARIAALQSGGQPLSQSERSFFEPRFGYDFSGVRVHTGSLAAEAARSVQARAFTVGRYVVFREGAYAPGTRAGRRLLAHELTHVVQQGMDGTSAGHAPVSSSPRALPRIYPIDNTHLQRQGEGGGQPAKKGKKKPSLPKAILQEVNSKRGKIGSLSWNDTLASSAAAYCKVMIDKQEFSHTADGKTIFKRISDAGYFPQGGGGKAGENLYYNPNAFAAQDAVTWWMGSPPHRKEILEPKYEEAGVSICSGQVKIKGKLREVRIAVMHFGAIHPTLTLSNPTGNHTGDKTFAWTVTGSVSDNIDPPTSIRVRVKVVKQEKGIKVTKVPKNPLTVKKDGSLSFTFETKGSGLVVLKTIATDTRGNSPKPETTKARVNP